MNYLDYLLGTVGQLTIENETLKEKVKELESFKTLESENQSYKARILLKIKVPKRWLTWTAL